MQGGNVLTVSSTEKEKGNLGGKARSLQLRVVCQGAQDHFCLASLRECLKKISACEFFHRGVFGSSDWLWREHLIQENVMVSNSLHNANMKFSTPEWHHLLAFVHSTQVFLEHVSPTILVEQFLPHNATGLSYISVEGIKLKLNSVNWRSISAEKNTAIQTVWLYRTEEHSSDLIIQMVLNTQMTSFISASSLQPLPEQSVKQTKTW